MKILAVIGWIITLIIVFATDNKASKEKNELKSVLIQLPGTILFSLSIVFSIMLMF